MVLLTVVISALVSLGWHSALPGRPVLALAGSCLTATLFLSLIAASHTTAVDLALIAFLALAISGVVRFFLQRARVRVK